MVYIIVLNWNSAQDTTMCVNSIQQLKNYDLVKVVICDNASNDTSYTELLKYVSEKDSSLIINENDIENYGNVNKKIILIKNNKNYGYAGGNNRGISFALNQDDMEYVWILNNDTEVDHFSLEELIKKSLSNNHYGVIGSKLVDYDRRDLVQAVGGKINKIICTTKPYGKDISVSHQFNEKIVENSIDYVIGASMFFTRICLEKIGLLCEDYFLYYEEIDLCNRVKKIGMKFGVACNSIIYHKLGASTNKGKSDIADYFSVRNRILISKKYYNKYTLWCRLSIFLVCCVRVKRFQFTRALKYLKIVFL